MISDSPYWKEFLNKTVFQTNKHNHLFFDVAIDAKSCDYMERDGWSITAK